MIIGFHIINSSYAFYGLNRFVRFVSTPEVLERFVTVEREIEQIENSIQENESNAAVGTTEADGMFRPKPLLFCWVSMFWNYFVIASTQVSHDQVDVSPLVLQIF